MGIMIQGGPVARLDEFYDLVTLLTNPAATKALMDQIRAEIAELEAATKAAADVKTRMAAVAATETRLAEREAAIVASEASHSATTGLLTRKTNELAEAAAQLQAERVAHETAKADALKAIATVRQQLDKDIAAAATRQSARDAELSAREKSLAEREETAKSMVIEYSGKLAALKKLTG